MDNVRMDKKDISYGIELIIARKRELRDRLKKFKPSNVDECNEYLDLSKEEKVLDWVLERAFVLQEFDYLKNDIHIEID